MDLEQSLPYVVRDQDKENIDEAAPRMKSERPRVTTSVDTPEENVRTKLNTSVGRTDRILD